MYLRTLLRRSATKVNTPRAAYQDGRIPAADVLKAIHQRCTMNRSMTWMKRLWIVLIAGVAIELSRGYFTPRLEALPIAADGWSRESQNCLRSRTARNRIVA